MSSEKLFQLPDDRFARATVVVDPATGLPVASTPGGPAGTGDASAANQVLQLDRLASIDAKLPAKVGDKVQTVTTNVAAKLRDASENYPNPGVWNETATVIAPGDLILQAGNTAGAGWIELSKSPFDVGGSTLIEMLQRFNMPVRISSAVTMSQRTQGQHIGSMELVSTDDWEGAVPVPDPVPVAIADASQAGAVITVNFTEAPPTPLRVGQRVNVFGFLDNRLNVSSATVATAPTPLQITLAGNAHGFTSTTIASTPGAGAAFVERVDVLGGARNGVAVLRENGTATNLSVYSRSEGGLARPSGTLAGSHQVSAGSDAATLLVTAPYAHAFAPGQQTRLDVSRDGFMVSDRGTGAMNAQFSVRYRHDEVVPNPGRPYKLRYRLRASKAPSRPICEIVSATKTGTTTATFVTRTPHGLATGQWVGHYGVANQANFAAQAGGVQVAVTGASTFTAVTGAAATAVSYGGFVWVSEGQQTLPGAVAQAVVNVARTDGVLTLTGSANWSGPVIGEIVEAYGIANAATGASFGVDGAYRVENVSTTSLVLTPVGATPTGANIAGIAAGGGIIRRTEMRIHYSVAVDYDPLLVDFAQGGMGEAGLGAPVNVTNAVTIAGSPTVNLSANQSLFTLNNLYWNETVANLGAGATHTGTGREATTAAGTNHRYSAFNVTAVANQAGTVRIEQSNDSATWRRATADVAVAVNAPVILSVPVCTRYYRSVYINGATATTELMVNSSFTAA